MNLLKNQTLILICHVIAIAWIIEISSGEQPPTPLQDENKLDNEKNDTEQIDPQIDNRPKDHILIGCDLNVQPVSDQAVSTETVPEQTQTTEVGDAKTIGKIVNLLSQQLVSHIGGTDNLLFSPFSLSVSLAKTYLGAGGNTAKEMEQVLGYNRFLGVANAGYLHTLFHHMINGLEDESGKFKLLVANGLFVQSGLKLQREFTDKLEEDYSAKVTSVDFANDEAGARDQINKWSYNHTEGKIPKLLESPLDPSTLLLLMNAIYFKGSWMFPFKETKVNYFYKADGTKKKTPFMKNNKRLPYFKDVELGYRFLCLPYEGDHISMLLVLPNERTDFPTVELTSELLNRVLQNLRLTSVIVEIPKFQIDYSRELSKDLRDLGLVTLFSRQYANLTGMRSENDLYASKLIHKAVIDVNEQGTEAAAVSGVIFTSRSKHSYRKFVANHPFLFCILDKRSNTILFMGRFSEP